MIQDTIKSYIAGLVDGEGCIAITRRKIKRTINNNWYFQPQVIISNTDRRMTNFLVDIYGSWVAVGTKQKKNHKQRYSWVITGDNMRQLLKDILPFLILKKRQAEIILSFPNYQNRGQSGRTSYELNEQYKLWKELRGLNKKGSC